MTKKKEVAKAKQKPAKNMTLQLTDEMALTVAHPDLNALLQVPEDPNAKAIGVLFAGCVVPICKNVFSIPEKLLRKSAALTMQAETMMPFELITVKKEIERLKMSTQSAGVGLVIEDGYMSYLAEAVEESDLFVNKYLKSVVKFCEAMEKIATQYTSQEAYFQNMTLNLDGVEIDPRAIVSPVQTLLMSLNKAVAGEGGWKIMAMAAAIDRIAKMLESEEVQKLFGSSSLVGMLNELDYRISPDENMFHESLAQLVHTVAHIGESKTTNNKEISELLTNSRLVKSNIASYING